MSIFPDGPLGKSSSTINSLGTLNSAKRSRQWAKICSRLGRSPFSPSRATKAWPTSPHLESKTPITAASRTPSIEAFTGEAARYEKRGLAQANSAIDELAKLMKDSVDYTCKISEEWRKAAMEATQQANEMFKKNMAN